MGIWSGIKHAINSTLGTSEFQPLDKIIKSQRTYAASSDILVPLVRDKGFYPSDYGKYYKISGAQLTTFVNGSLRISAQARLQVGGHDSGGFYFKITKNGQDYDESYRGASGTNGIAYDKTITVDRDIVIETGAVYEFYIQRTVDARVTFNNLDVCGRLTDLSMLNYITG